MLKDLLNCENWKNLNDQEFLREFMITSDQKAVANYLGAGFIPNSHKRAVIKRLFKGDPGFLYDLRFILDYIDMKYIELDPDLKHDQNYSIYIPEIDLRINTQEYYDKEDDEWLIESVSFS